MSATDEMADVVKLACLTEDRSPGEQRSMLAVALRIDKERGAFTSLNHHPHEPELIEVVEMTYAPAEGEPVAMSASQRSQYERLVAKWELCAKHGKLVGAHTADENCGAP